ncbi:hypothetical protein [Roseovarius sp. TE539]|uniref:hypothetical protein n=1 Tax=Roseovarius sp. TE539 TaxID=2249812 RepID=UPI0011BEED1D|nr:hypothetical protein [Roseovarius sp. TE539]
MRPRQTGAHRHVRRAAAHLEAVTNLGQAAGKRPVSDGVATTVISPLLSAPGSFGLPAVI